MYIYTYCTATDLPKKLRYCLDYHDLGYLTNKNLLISLNKRVFFGDIVNLFSLTPEFL